MSAYEAGILFFVGSFVGWMLWALISILWEIRRNPEDFDPPTEELEMLPTAKIGPRLENPFTDGDIYEWIRRGS